MILFGVAIVVAELIDATYQDLGRLGLRDVFLLVLLRLGIGPENPLLVW